MASESFAPWSTEEAHDDYRETERHRRRSLHLLMRRTVDTAALARIVDAADRSAASTDWLRAARRARPTDGRARRGGADDRRDDSSDASRCSRYGNEPYEDDGRGDQAREGVIDAALAPSRTKMPTQEAFTLASLEETACRSSPTTSRASGDRFLPETIGATLSSVAPSSRVKDTTANMRRTARDARCRGRAPLLRCSRATISRFSRLLRSVGRVSSVS